MKFPISVVNRKPTPSFRIASWLLAIAPLWLMLAAVNTSAHAQTSKAAAASSSTTTSPADWTEFHRDNMQRWNPYETVLGVNSVGQLGLKWSYATGGSVYSSPAVASGAIYFGSRDGNVYSLNASTGVKLWTYATAGEVDSSPAVVNGVVYIGSGDGNLYALNATTGAPLWSYNTGDAIRSGVTVANGVVYFESLDADVYALNASTGAKLWSVPISSESFDAPAVANGVVYFGANDYNVYALNANTGATLWSYNTGYYVDASPAVTDGVVYIGGITGEVYALNATTGASLWGFGTFAFAVDDSPAVANGVVYIGSLFYGNPPLNNVYALNASTGAKLWSYSTVMAPTSPALANGVVYVGSADGNVYALNASTGAKLWSYNTGSPIGFSSPAVVNGMLYTASLGGKVFAFALGNADLYLRIIPTPTTVHQGDLITYAFPVWNLGPSNADYEVLNTQVPAGTILDYVRISGTPGLGTCTTPPYQGTGSIVCHENSAMAPNTTWTVRVVVKVTAPVGTVITESAATLGDNPDPNLANNTATVSTTVQ